MILIIRNDRIFLLVYMHFSRIKSDRDAISKSNEFRDAISKSNEFHKPAV